MLLVTNVIHQSNEENWGQGWNQAWESNGAHLKHTNPALTLWIEDTVEPCGDDRERNRDFLSVLNLFLVISLGFSLYYLCNWKVSQQFLFLFLTFLNPPPSNYISVTGLCLVNILKLFSCFSQFSITFFCYLPSALCFFASYQHIIFLFFPLRL